MTYYINDHVSQYCSGCSSITRSSGCTWTSGRNGADAATGGMVDITPDQVKAKVKNSEETTPETPGWSIQDLDKAMGRLGVPFQPRNGQGWAKVVEAHDAGLYVVLQGLSAEFGNHTCSGAFNGTHAIGVHPDENAQGLWRIDDPICPTSRYETEAILRRYAERFSRSVAFGVFTKPVPKEELEVSGLQFRITDRIDGIATVVGGGHALIRVDNQVHVAIPAGQQREVAAKIVLTAPTDDGKFKPGTTGYLVGNVPGVVPDNSIATMLLASDCTFSGTQDCEDEIAAAIAADRATASVGVVYP